MFKNLSMSKKIYSVIGILAAVAVVIALIGIVYLGQMNDRINHLAHNTAEQVRISGKIVEQVERVQRAEKDLLLAASEEEMQGYVEEMEAMKKAVKDDLKVLKGLSDGTGQKYVTDFEERWDQFVEVSRQVQQLALLNSNVEAKLLSQGEGRKAFEEAASRLSVLTDRNDREVATGNILSRVKRAAKKGSLATKIRTKLIAMQRGEKNLILAKTQEEMDEYAKNIGEAENEVNTLLTDLEGLADSGEESQLINEFKTGFSHYQQVNSNVRELSRENGNNRAFELSAGEGQRYLKNANEALRSLIAYANDSMDNSIQVSDARYAAARGMMIGVSVIGILGALALAIYLMRGLTGNLNRFIRWLSEGAGELSAASNQVSQSSQELAEGASEQAASVEETSASLEEMGAMTRQNTDSSKKANSLAQETKQAAEEGDEHMDKMLTAIKDLDASSEETSKIIKTIDEIAFQTNLLALNAAVEAARAGEAGQGFAVVADEVRSLAQRAAEAAKNTAELIDGSKENTKRSVQMVDEVAEALQSITGKARQVNELVGEITAASEEQNQGIGQVNTAMSQIDQVTQSIASNAEESASASEELNAQADTLMQTVTELTHLVEGANPGSTHGNGSQGLTEKAQSLFKQQKAKNQNGSNGTQSRQNGHSGSRNGSTTQQNPEEAFPLESNDDDGFEEF